MLALALHALGDCVVSYAKPLSMNFNSVKFIGSAKYDNIHATDSAKSNSDILSITTQELYGTNTIWLADFENNLDVGNYPSATPVASYLTFRKSSADDIYTYIGESLTSSINDYKAKNYENYEYMVLPKYSEGVYGNYNSDTIASAFYGWFLVDEDNTIIYKFDMDIDSGPIEFIEDFKTYENYSQYPVTSKGIRKYHKGKLSTIPYSFVSNDYVIDVNLLEELESFITNSDLKYLKNTMGSIWKIQTSNFSYKINDPVSDQPYTINFDFLEVANV